MVFRKTDGQEGARALFEEAKHQLSAQGFIPRGGQLIDATLIPVPKQHNKKEENEQIRQGKTPDNWTKKNDARKIPRQPGRKSTVKVILAINLPLMSIQNIK
ncbi:hypothetical protein XBJ2_760004 [Xenorhabdus bovienii str. Jollieti]|nr:hypothetical protein XBJ2_760004 [Xenorhabdus bovienii str. Jollieti]